MATPKFRPYRGLDEKIKALPQQPGYVYFATDTGRIYLDYDNERIPMGGNGASLYYANDTDVVKDLLDNYFIDIDTIIDAGSSLKANDLIINGDGAFYRVLEITDEHTAKCTRIAVSGTGGGGGSGDGGGGTGPTQKNITLELIGEFPTTFVYGKKTEVTFKSEALYDTYIRYNIVIQGNNDTKTLNYQAKTGEEFTFDVGSELYQGNNIIVVTAFADNSGEATLKYPYRESIVFALKKNPEFNPKVVQTGPLSFFCIPVGTTQKTLEIYIDGVLEDTKTISSSLSDSNYTVDIKAQPHGTHTLQAILKANVGGADVETDPISYQIAWNDGESTAPLVWFPEGYPESIVQYEDLLIEFMVYHPEKTTEIETHFYKEGIELASSPRLLNYDYTAVQKWNITDYQVGSNSYTIRVGTTSQPIHVEVEPDENRDLEIRTGGLILNLETSGRSNEENISSRTSWISKNTTVPTAVTFNNFNWYNNGWIEDDDGRSCLRISNGASISIPVTDLGVLNSASMTEALTLEFRFKARNIQEYATLITTSSSEDEDGKVTIVKEVSTDKGVIGQLYGNNLGFCIGTQEAFLKSSNTIVNARYREDEIINLSFVIEASSNMSLLYIYLQGILSGIAKYGTTDKFDSGAQYITFNSEYCDIDLYNIRIYKGAKLESSDIVHNYISDLKDVKSYDANQIVTTVNSIPTIDYNKMLQYNQTHPDETIIPYMVIESRDSDNKLPYIKGGKKPVNIEFRNPALDYAYNMGYITAEQYLHGAPSFTYTSGKKSLDVQGTSSQGYPRRNYKWKAKQEDAKWRYTAGPLQGYPIYEYKAEEDKYIGQDYEDVTYKKYYLDSDIGETTFCFKADYMESSSTHNTGYASYVSTLYNKHPLKDYYPGVTLPESIRTTVYGFPMIVFQKTGADTYEFVGRYNFNLDKGATDSCGFSYDGDSYVRGEDGKFLPMEEIAECWEICNNQGQRTSFVKVDFEETTDAYEEVDDMNIDTFEPNKYYIVTNINTSTGEHTYELATEYDANKVYYTKQSGILSVLDDFEYRYSFYEDEIDHAIEGTDEFAGIEQSKRNEVILHRMRNLKDMAMWLESTDVSVSQKLGMVFGTYTEVELTADTFEPTVHYEYDSQYKIWKATTSESVFDASKKYATCVPEPVTLKDGKTYRADNQEYRLAKFLAEFTDHFDQEYCEVYFIMTELLHLYDSRGKNCMMATWGPQKEGGNYIWYPIFYDIDTQLGINNSGVPTWDYFVNPTEEYMFSTSNGVLWNNMWAVFKQSIQNRYVDLRKNQLNIDAMDGYYNSHPILGRGDLDSWRSITLDETGMAQLIPKINSFAKIGKKPVMIYNVDQYYKYIGPATGGYINTSGGTSYTDTFFYCLQGSRELMRYLYLRNRLNFVDSKWHGDAYSIEGALGHLKMRYDANLLKSTSDNFLYTDDISKHNTVENKYTDAGELIGAYTLWNWDTYGPHPLDCPTDFQGVRSFLRQYMSLQTDKTVYDPVPCDGYEAVTLNVSADIQSSIKLQPALTQQLVYLGGGEYIADLGDLGTKYLDEFVATTLKRLISLRLGSDVPNYFNNQLNSGNCKIGAHAYNLDGSRNTEAKTLLQELVLTGLTGLDGELDVSGSEKLKTLRALRTILTSVVLADGVQIETLHLPNTITNISLVEPVALQGILTSTTVEPEDKGLFIEGITNSNGNYSKDIAIDTYAVTGGKLGYDSYKLLDILVNFKKAMIDRNSEGSKTLSVNLKEVNWSPYTLVEPGEPYYEENASLYFYDNQRFSLVAYTTYDKESWEYYTKNERMYLLDEEYFSSNENVLIDLNIFDTFIETYEYALQDYAQNKLKDKNYFKSATSTQPISIPEVTGLMYVNNTTSIDEAQVANHYLKYFPKMKFFFKNVTNAYVATYVTSIDGVEEVIYTERKSADATDLTLTYPPLANYEPVRLNYDFVGWSLTQNATPGASGVYHPNYTANFETEWAKLAYTSTAIPMKFYAIFDSTKFAAHFKNYFKDGTIEDITTEYVTAGEYLYAPDVLPATDESALPDDQRYKLLGWVTDTKYCFPETEAEGLKRIVDLSSIRSENVDRTFYACYIVESVFDSVTNPDLFSYSYETYNESEDPSQNSAGYNIQPKGMLNGKITIPGTYNGLPVIALVGTNGQSGLTHIYFEKPENIRYLSGIYSNSSLRYFDFPSGTRKVFSECFQYNPKLKFPTKMANSNLLYVGSYIFRGSFAETDGQIELIQLPGSLKNIDTNAFSNFHVVPNPMPDGHYRVLEVSFGGPGDPSSFDIGSISSGAKIFGQNQLWGVPPSDENASVKTPIKKFTFYRETGSTVPSVDDFDAFVKSNKVVGDGYSVVETAVVDTTRE